MAGGNLQKLIGFSEEFCKNAGECGHRAFCIMAGCLDGKVLRSRLLSYEGPFGVGYAVASFRDAYVALARESLAYYLDTGREMPVPEHLPDVMINRQGRGFCVFEEGRGAERLHRNHTGNL